MPHLILRRLLHAIPVLLGVSFVVFAAIQLVPGDVARTILGFSATEERVQDLRAALGLDRPLLVQYGLWLQALLGGDLGRSLALNVPVTTVVLDKIGNSLLLMGASLLLVLGLGLVLAVLAAAAHRRPVDRAVTGLTLLLASMPPFWLGLILLYLFGLQLGLFPISGMYDMAAPGGVPDLLHHLVLPAVTTAASSVAVVARVLRGTLIDQLAQPYTLAARARGALPREVVWREAVPNALPTFATIGGLQIGYLFGSAIFSEIVFNWPGIGLQLYQAIIARDIPVIQGCVLAVAAVFVLGNLVADLIAYALDPRRSAR
jgi:peptide/nickel transport system permease protein